MRRQLAAALLGAALLTGGAQAVAEPPAARYVADEADVLSSETEQDIIDKNQSLFENTGGEIVVVSVDFMDGMDAADYAMAVAESWGGIGDESLNNGFLLVYACLLYTSPPTSSRRSGRPSPATSLKTGWSTAAS